MKWTMIGLFGLGLVAAVCAAVLVASMRGGDSEGPATQEILETTIAVAARDLSTMTVLDAEAVETRTVPVNAVPPGSLTDAVQVIGKVLQSPMKAGQPFVPTIFAPDGSAAHLALGLKSGLRAVNITLTDSMGLENLLMPGSVVDVIVTMRDVDDDPVAITLLQAVRVLAIGDRTSPTGSDAAAMARSRVSGSQRPTVSLLVNSKQAEALKLAMQEGSISLALRNPTDEMDVDEDGTDLKSLSHLFADGAVPRKPKSGEWETTIVRGGEAESVIFGKKSKPKTVEID